MDNRNPSTAEVPTFKLAKVGKERKRGGAWFGGGRGAGSGLRLLRAGAGSGGSGAAVGSGAVGGKLLMIFAVSAVASLGSSRLSAVLRGDSKPAASQAKKSFAPKAGVAQKYDDLSGVIKGENSIPNSMGYVSGSIDGLTAEERAKKAAEEAAARKAEEEAQKKADEEAAKQEAPMPAAIPADAAALLAGAGKEGKPGLKSFNKLSSSFGGAAGGSKLSGGPGLAGGVGRGFAAPSVGNAKTGSIASFKSGARASTSRSARAASTPSRSRGFAKRQLLNANRLSRAATSTGRAETASESAAEAFVGGAPTGIAIGGAGTSGGTSQGTDATMTPNNDGSAVGGTGTCASDEYMASDGTCKKTTTPDTDNACKYQKEIDLAKNLLMAIAILAAIALIVDWITPIGKAIATAIRAAICIMGAVVCGLGIKIATMSGGDFMIGAILGVVGGYIAVVAYTSTYLLTSSGFAGIAASALIASALGMMTTASAGAPKND